MHQALRDRPFGRMGALPDLFVRQAANQLTRPSTNLVELTIQLACSFRHHGPPFASFSVYTLCARSFARATRQTAATAVSARYFQRISWLMSCSARIAATMTLPQ